MAKDSLTRIDLLQGALDMPILRTLLFDPHGGDRLRSISSASQLTSCRSSADLFTYRLEESKWQQLTVAISRVMRPVKEN